MKRMRFILLIGIALFTSCTSNTIYKKPEDLIPKDEMVNLLVDVYLANGAYAVKNINGKRKVDYMPLVYEKYGIDSARFQRSNIYYMSRIDEYEYIFKKVKARLLQIKKEDSIRNYRLRKPKLPKKRTKKNKNVKKEKKQHQ